MSSSKSLLWFVCLIFVVGSIFGSLSLLFMSESQRITIENQWGLLLKFRSIPDPVLGSNEIWQKIFQYLLLGCILFILSLSVIGIPVLLFYICIKGFALGFTTSFIIQSIGSKGIVFVLLTIIPQNLLLVPTLILYVTISTTFAKSLLFERIIRVRGRIKPQFLNFLLSSAILFAIFIVVSLFENLLSPYLMERAVTFIL